MPKDVLIKLIVKMVREGFPPISRPLPVLLQGPEYDDIPVEPKPKEISTFEKSSLSYSWFHNLWTNIISAKWAGNLLAVTSKSSAPLQISDSLSYSSGPPYQPKSNSLLSKRPSSGKLPSLCWSELTPEDR
jgi:hypothetical protein